MKGKRYIKINGLSVSQELYSFINNDLLPKTKINNKLKQVYSTLDPWQTTLGARHEDRPKAKFFIENLFEDFIPLSGDRFYGEDHSLKFIKKLSSLEGVRIPGERRHQNRTDKGIRKVNKEMLGKVRKLLHT